MTDIADLRMEVDSTDVDKADRSVDKLAQTMHEAAASSALYSKRLAGEYSLSAKKIEQATRSVARMKATHAREELNTSRLVINAQRGLTNMQQKATATEDKAARQAFQRSMRLQKAREAEAAATERALQREETARTRNETQADAAFRKEYQRHTALQKAREAAAAAAEREAARERAAAERSQKAEDTAARQQYQRLLTIQKAREHAAATAERAAEREAAASRRAEIAEANRRTAWIRESDRMTAMFVADSKRRQKEFEEEERRSVKHGRGIIATLSHIRGTMLSLSGIAAGVGVLALYNSLNKYTELTNIFKVLGFEGEAAADKLRDIQDIARATRSPVEELSKIYQKTTMASKELGASQDEILQFTKNVGLALAQQGGATISTRGALLQLSQAIGMGTVRAEEFNSMLEGGYPILVAAARGIEETGGSVMKLRQMMLAGELSSKKFFEAILSQSDNLEKVFGRTVPTLSQAVRVFADTFMVSIGEMDHAVGFSATLSRGIINLTSAFVDFSRMVSANADTVQAFGHALQQMFIFMSAAAVVHFARKLDLASVSMTNLGKATAFASATMKSFLPAAVISAVISATLVYRKHGELIEDIAEANKMAAESQRDFNRALSEYDSSDFTSASIMKEATRSRISDLEEEIRLKQELFDMESKVVGGNNPARQEYMEGLQSELDQLSAELIRAEGLFGMADGRAKALAVTVGEVAVATDGMSDKAIKAAHEANVSIQQQLEMARAILTSGEKSAQVEAVKREQARATAIEFAKQKDFNDEVTSSYVEQQMALYETNLLLERQKTYSEMIANAWREIKSSNEEAQEQRLEAQKTTAEYERQIELSKAVAQYGEESAQAEALRFEEVRLATEEYIEQNNLVGEVADNLRVASSEQQALSSAANILPPVLSEASREAMVLAQNLGLAMGQLRGVFQGIASAQRVAQNIARINLETVGDEVGREREITRYNALEASGTAAYAAIRNGSSAALTEIKKSTDAVAEGAAETKRLELAASEADRAFREAEKSAGKSGSKVGGAASKAAKEQEKLNNQLDKQAETIKASLDPFSKYKQEMADLEKLQGRLSEGEMAQAIQELNEEFIDSLPLVGDFVDTITEGLFNGFDGTLKSITDIFKSWLQQMIATAAKNQIMVSMGVNPMGGGLSSIGGIGSSLLGSFGGGGSLGSALAAAGAPVGPTGILGGLGSVFSGVQSGFASGGILGGLTGGISSSIGGITSGLAAGGLGGITAAIGAAIPIIGAVAGVFALGKSLFGRKLKDTGIDVAFDTAEGLMARTYKFYKGGLFRSDKTSYDNMSSKMADPIEQGFRAVSDQVEDFANILGQNADAIENVNWSFKFSTKGMSEEEIQTRFQDEFAKYGNALASAVTKSVSGTKTVTRRVKTGSEQRFWGGEQNTFSIVPTYKTVTETVKTYVSSLNKFKKAGETNVETLSRLATSLTAVNTAYSALGLTTMKASLQSGSLASSIVNLFDGVEGLASAADFYYQNFYTQEERYKNAQKAINQELKAINAYARPKTMEEFRALVERFDAAGKSKGVARLLKLAPAFKEMLDLAGDSTDSSSSTSTDNSERLGLLRQLYTLQGNITKLRELELKQLEPGNRALQERIWRLEDEAAIQSQFDTLQAEAARLLEKTAFLRKLELEELDSSNHGLQRWIWRLEDAQAAAASAESAVLSAAQAERTRIEELRSRSESIRDTATQALDSVAELTERQRLLALQQIQHATLSGQVWDENLTTLVDKASQLNSNNFSSSVDYLIAGAKTAAALNALAERQEQEAQTAEDRLEAALEKYGLQEETVKSLDEALRDLSTALERLAWAEQGAGSAARIPGFASGGSFSGGLRLVGERGAEIEATGPSRITNSQNLLDALRDEDVEKLLMQILSQTIKTGNETRSLLINVSENTRKMNNKMDDFQTNGMPTRDVT